MNNLGGNRVRWPPVHGELALLEPWATETDRRRRISMRNCQGRHEKASQRERLHPWRKASRTPVWVKSQQRLGICHAQVHIAGIVPEPGEQWMNQIARNLTDPSGGFLWGCRFLIHDRSALFSEQFRAILQSVG